VVFISPVNFFPPRSPSFVLLKYNSLHIVVKVWGTVILVLFFKLFIYCLRQLPFREQKVLYSFESLKTKGKSDM